MSFTVTVRGNTTAKLVVEHGKESKAVSSPQENRRCKVTIIALSLKKEWAVVKRNERTSDEEDKRVANSSQYSGNVYAFSAKYIVNAIDICMMFPCLPVVFLPLTY